MDKSWTKDGQRRDGVAISNFKFQNANCKVKEWTVDSRGENIGQKRDCVAIAKVKMQIVNFKLEDKGREHRFEDCSVTVALR